MRNRLHTAIVGCSIGALQVVCFGALADDGSSNAASPQNAQVLLQIHANMSVVSSPKARNQSNGEQGNFNGASLEGTTYGAGNKTISGSLTEWGGKPLNAFVDHLVESHFDRTPEAKTKAASVDHFRSAPQVVIAKLKDSVNYSLPYQGVNPSKRMSELVLSDQAKVRDAATAEYQKQIYVDKIHAQIISSLMQLAMGLGTQDPFKSKQMIESGMHLLSELAGEDDAQAAKSMLEKISLNRPISSETFDRPTWDSIGRDEKLNSIVKAAMEKDPVILELRKHVDKYAHPGKIKEKASGAIEAALSSATWLAPGFAIPLGAEAALNAYILSTGGSEEGKIERILVYNKRLESRNRLYTQEASLALDNYRYAQVTRNSTLLLFSQSLVAELTSPQMSSTIFNDPETEIVPNVVPGIKSAKHNEDES